MSSEPPVVALVGPSGVGKTTLLAALLAALAAQGLRVGAVKHSSHPVQADRPGKDSHRLYDAGADAVVLAMPGQLASFARRPAERPRLGDALAALPSGLDLILVEGFAWEPIPRYVLLPPDGDDERSDLEHRLVLRVLRAPARAPGAPPRYAPTLVKELAAELAARAGTSTPDSSSERS